MPSPVLALPCGSRSTISTRSPIAASAVARLMAVVVLPTPPFWLASVMMRGPGFIVTLCMQSESIVLEDRLTAFEIGYFENDAVGIDLASMFYQIITPQESAFFNLSDVIPAFVQKA